jgi:hypothetical protein
MRKAIKNTSDSLKKNHTELDALTKYDLEIMMMVFNVDMLLNQYVDGNINNDQVVFTDNILKGYDLRKSGGLGNTIIFRIYMREYIEYVFDGKHGVIPKTWDDFGGQVKDSAESFFEALTSDPVQNFVSTLPLKIAGLDEEKFENPEVVEHFGFLKKIFAPIVNTFISLGKIAMGIVKIMSNPFGIFKLLIGLIVGCTVLVTYLIIVALGIIIMYPAAFFWVLWLKLVITFVWFWVFLAIALIYVILWLIDSVTGGFIFSLLRCENLPNAWHKRPGYEHRNGYKRTFICSYPCASRYRPGPGGMCFKRQKGEPSYCPQQILYEVYKKNTTILNKAHVFEYTPSLAYYGKTIDEKNGLWEDMFDKKIDYLEGCKEGIKEYDHFSKTVCHYYHMKSKEVEGMSTKEKINFKKIMNICEQTYCSRFSKNENAQAKFCDIPKPDKNDLSGIEDQKPDVITNVILIIIVLILVISAYTAVYNVAGVKQSYASK